MSPTDGLMELGFISVGGILVFLGEARIGAKVAVVGGKLFIGVEVLTTFVKSV